MHILLRGPVNCANVCILFSVEGMSVVGEFFDILLHNMNTPSWGAGLSFASFLMQHRPPSLLSG